MLQKGFYITFSSSANDIILHERGRYVMYIHRHTDILDSRVPGEEKLCCGEVWRLEGILSWQIFLIHSPGGSTVYV